MSGKLELILGGARSGKSGFAERTAKSSGLPVSVIVTATAGDAEMAERIRRHRAERPAGWKTVEEPIALAQALLAEAQEDRCVVVDCLTVWLSNLMVADGDIPETWDVEKRPLFARERDFFLEVLPGLPGHIVLVANEVGLGLVPMTPMGRFYRDEAGRLNQALARLCVQVSFVVSGLPLMLKN